MSEVFPKFSRITCSWAACIWIGSFVLRKVLNFFVGWLGHAPVVILIWGLFAGAGFFLGMYLVRQAAQSNLWFYLVFLLGIVYAATFDIAEERIHLLKFGILGWLVCRDLFFVQGPVVAIKWAVLCAFLVSSIDETIQWALPYRVGDLRDVIFGTIGGGWGGALFALVHRKQ